MKYRTSVRKKLQIPHIKSIYLRSTLKTVMGHEFSSINSIDSKRPLSHVFINQPEEEEGGGERGGREGMILILNFNFEDS